MNNDLQTTKTFSPQKQMPQSPWKKPNRVSLIRVKSLKRKSELLISNSNLNDSNQNNSSFNNVDKLNENNIFDGGDCERLAKTRKTLFNRFSVNTSLNFSYGFGSSPSNNSPFRNSFNENANSSYDNSKLEDKNDLYSFFSGSKPKQNQQNEESERILNDEKIITNKQKLNEKILSSSEFITKIYSTSSSKSLYEQSQNEGAPNEKKETYLFENDNLLPIDWSLKIKVRFLSEKQFSCYSGIRSQHESEALLNYSKYNMFYKNLFDNKFRNSEENKDLFKTLFCESISYWTFPYLPWLNLYPRNVGMSNLCTDTLNTSVIQALSKSWNQSFKSLYNSLKSNQCPYFYLLTQSFTVLFRAQKINGFQEMHAILTPSTKGLRQSLKDINFTMPLINNNNRKSDQFDENTNDCTQSGFNNETNLTTDNNNQSVEASSNLINSEENSNSDELKKQTTGIIKNTNQNEDDENDSDDSDEPDEWLEQIGLNSAVNFKSSIIKNQQIKDLSSTFNNFDNRPKSTLLFDNACDVQALFNFLLNSKTCVATTGPLTGVPPTLLSPLPFLNANLQKLKVEQNVVKSLKPTGESLTQYALDFIGPVMPYHVHRLCNLFRLTQSGQFDMTAVANEQSVALNSVKYYTTSNEIIDFNSDSEEQKKTDEESLSKFLDLSEAKSLENMFGVFGEPKAVKTISCKEETFYCN